MTIRSILLFTLATCGFAACRASFEDVKVQAFLASQEDFSEAVKDLKNDRELARDQSPKYNCRGIVIIRERGKDKNHDGILQPEEVLESSSECRVDPITDPGAGGQAGGGKPGGGGTDCPHQGGGTKEGGADCPQQSGGDKGGGSDCPNQSGNMGSCPDNAGQNDPSQAAKK